eukprot:TRINITY_DN56565_c0_g1_i1.p2 TRINITY_DN56565_c0_g1~~TRINITY_DN56565_c0_g1_i1.p2  ORF type:complete len:118 (-),score=4.11 TRINITY_DN56565_c0_g1_i1:273-626(-)
MPRPPPRPRPRPTGCATWLPAAPPRPRPLPTAGRPAMGAAVVAGSRTYSDNHSFPQVGPRRRLRRPLRRRRGALGPLCEARQPLAVCSRSHRLPEVRELQHGGHGAALGPQLPLLLP